MAFRCPKCKRRTAVMTSREAPYGVYRHRKCEGCGHSFGTQEREPRVVSPLVRELREALDEM